VELDEKIEKLNDKIRELAERFNEKLGSLKEDSSGRPTNPKELKELFEKLKVNTKER